MSPQSFIFVGRYGSGKGTQAKLLMEALKKSGSATGIIYLETGAEFRKFMKGDGFTARHAKTIVDRGMLMPEFMCVHMWASLLVRDYTGAEHLVFDGSPRKLLEAQVLGQVFSFYERDKPWVIYLDVGHDESHKRIKLRSLTSGRADEGEREVENRKIAYENDVVPTIEWYRTNPSVRFLDVPGERPIAEIHADIVKRIALE